MGRKLGALPPFLGRGAGCSSSTMWPAPRPTSMPSAILIHPDSSSHLATRDMGILIHPAIWPRYGPKIGGALLLCGRGAGSPSNTMWPVQRPTCMPSFILIHPTVWPQYTKVTDRTGQTMVRQHRANRFTNGRPKTRTEGVSELKQC